MTLRSSEYMVWAKTCSQSRFNLATSGLMNFPLKELGVEIGDLEISGPSLYGYEPLQQALADKYGVKPSNIFAATGTSMANHLAMAAILERGDEVVIEHPAYEPIIALADYLGAKVKRFHRSFDRGFEVEVGEVERSMSRRTRLIVLTNLHNPTSVLTDAKRLAEIGELARSLGARVLVDEVYLDVTFAQKPNTAFRLGDHFVVTTSLTKAFGLSGLRCGAVIADERLVEQMWQLNDLFGVIPAHTAERLSVLALERMDRVAKRAKEILDGNRTLVNQFLDSRDDLECVRFPFGTVLFPRLRSANADELCRILRERHETTVVPGRFFGMPEHFRVGLGGDAATLAGGLERLGNALDELREEQKKSVEV